MKYRTEIDGLRAIAVIAVILYHANLTFKGFNILSGGFIGVDIFFVISGYLITSIILHNLQQKTFTFLDFYERRARRILPALLFVLLISTPLAWLCLLPMALKEYAGSLLASILFGANFFFYQKTNYIAEPSSLKPFLHIWSLSIEEQFYALMPIILCTFWIFFKKRMTLLFGICFLISLTIAEWTNQKYPNFAFYLLPTRSWELLAGVLLATSELKSKKFNSSALTQTMPLVGLLIITLSFILFDKKTPHPSIVTIIPILGVALLIKFSKKGELITNLLSNKYLVKIGLISYSLYLWHYPLFAFYRLSSATSKGEIKNKILLATALVLISMLTYKYIEQPFRNKNKISRKILFSVIAISSIFLIALSTTILKQNGFANRFPPLLRGTIQSSPLEDLKQNGLACFDRSAEIGEYCRLTGTNTEETFYLVGDSHLAAFASQLWDDVKKRNGSLIDLTVSGCFYTPSLEVVLNGKVTKCSANLNNWRRKFLLASPPSIIMIGGRLPVYYEGTWFNNKEGGIENDDGILLLQSVGGNNSEKERKSVISNVIINSIQELLRHGHTVILIYPIPEAGWNIPLKFIRDIPKPLTTDSIKHWMENNTMSTSYEVYLERTKNTQKIYNSIPNHTNLIRIHPENLFCNNKVKNRCITYDNSNIFYSDDDHLSAAGGTQLVKLIFDTLESR